MSTTRTASTRQEYQIIKKVREHTILLYMGWQQFSTAVLLNSMAFAHKEIIHDANLLLTRNRQSFRVGCCYGNKQAGITQW